MKKSIVADLHNHSTISDGEYSPTELVIKAKEFGLKAMALTDHDTIDGLEEATRAGLKYGITVVPGVEVSLAFKRSYFVGTLHLLLYFAKELLSDATFQNSLNKILGLGRGLPLVKARVEAINKVFGLESNQPVLQRNLVPEELTAYSPNVTRRHFALALTEKHGIEDKDEINKIIGNESPAYIPSGVDVKLVTPVLEQYPVLRVFAHPAAGSFPGASHYKEVLPPLEIVEQLFPEFLEAETMGLDGIEVYYPGHTKEHQLLLLEWAEKYRLFVTGGSDCHDSVQRPPGVTGMTQEELDIVLKKINQRNNHQKNIAFNFSI